MLKASLYSCTHPLPFVKCAIVRLGVYFSTFSEFGSGWSIMYASMGNKCEYYVKFLGSLTEVDCPWALNPNGWLFFTANGQMEYRTPRVAHNFALTCLSALCKTCVRTKITTDLYRRYLILIALSFPASLILRWHCTGAECCL